MKYQLNNFNRNVLDKELLDDLKRIASKLGVEKLSSREYNKNGGKYTAGTIGVRFGSWNNAVEKAGLNFFLRHNSSDVELFENLEQVWIKLGRQPVSRDMKRPISEFSPSAYINKFGTFRKALETFVIFVNEKNLQEQEVDILEEEGNPPDLFSEVFIHKTKRFPSERLKVQVLMRDGNTCRLCGITLTGDNIHFDHVAPWSKGGETTLENMQILCAAHNLAKGNIEL